MKRSRRDFLRRAGAVGVAAPMATVLACESGSGEETPDAGTIPPDEGTDEGPPPDEGPAPDDLDEYEHEGEPGLETMFSHGVASGDPLTDAVILWTRVSTGATDPVDVWWEIATDTAFDYRVAIGTVQADESGDFTVKLDVADLDAGTTYYYRFACLGRWSPTGRTRTAGTDVSRVRLGVCSCSNLTGGYFHAYRELATADVDAVLHLGDYFYENAYSAFVAERQHEPPYETISLSDYRTRYAQYRRDPDQQEAHRQHPWITVWDDHELANNAWATGADNHQDGVEGTWPDRRAAAVQAYNEWMPIRTTEPDRIYRAFSFGDLVDLIMLDTRLIGRSKQTKDEEEMKDPSRTILGEEQEAWLQEQLTGSTATWRVLGQQVIVDPVEAGGVTINPDQWDGYKAARTRLLADIASVGDVVILTGDIHSSWAVDVPEDATTYDPETGEGSVAAEFVAPGVTSGFPLDANLGEIAKQLNPHIKYGDVTHRGYFVLDVDGDRAQAAWRHYLDPRNPNEEIIEGGVFETLLGSRHVTEAETATPGRENGPEPAP